MCYRCYFTLVQGTWFHQIAFSLYSVSSPDASGYKPGVMNLTEPENIMVVTLMYSWHLIGCAVGRFTNEMRSLKPLSFSFFLFDNVFLASLNSFYYNQTYLFFFAFISFFFVTWYFSHCPHSNSPISTHCTFNHFMLHCNYKLYQFSQIDVLLYVYSMYSPRWNGILLHVTLPGS